MEQGRFRYRVAAVPARREPDDVEASHADHQVDGWELVRARLTKDGISTLLLYRRPA